MTMGHKSGLLTLLVALAIVGCSSVSVNTDYDENADFSSFLTYAWVPEGQDDEYRVSGLLDRRIRNAVEDQLEQKGFQKTDGSAHVLVNYLAGVNQKVDVTSNDYGYWRGWGWGTSDVDVYTYNEGTLVIDLISATENQLVWRGVAKGVVSDSAPSQDQVNGVVQQIFNQYPPGS